MHRARFGWILLAAGSFASPARSENPRWDFGGPECAGSARQFERRLAELLEPGERERLSGRVRVVRHAGALAVELNIEMDGRPLGSRRFETKSCARAAETTAVAASLAVYSSRGQKSAPAASGASDAVWSTRPEPTPEPPTVVAPASPRAPSEPPLEPRIAIFGMAELGALPKPGWGGGVALELGVGPRWSFGVLGAMTAEQVRPTQPGELLRFSDLSILGRTCAAPWVMAPWRFDGCAGLRVLRATGTGQGFDANYSAALTSVAPSLGGSLLLRAPRRIEWRCELDAALPLSRRRFLVDAVEVSRAAVVVGTLRLGVGLRF